MLRPHWLLILVWALAAASAPAGDGHIIEQFQDEATLLVDLGEGESGEDGCSKAYDKFKAEIEKMAALKDKAEKKSSEGDKKMAAAESGLKRCKDDQSEVMEKATYKKDIVDKKIKDSADAKFKEMKKAVDEKAKDDKKKADEKVAAAKKKEEAQSKKAAECKKKFDDTTKEMKTTCEQNMSKFKSKSKAEFDTTLKNEVESKVLKATGEVKKQVEEKCSADCDEKIKACDAKADKVKKQAFIDKGNVEEEHKAALKAAKKEVPEEVEKDLVQTKDKLAGTEKDLSVTKSKLVKEEADKKTLKAELTEKLTKSDTLKSDCLVREKTLEKEVADMKTKVKTQEIELEEANRNIESLKTQLQSSRASENLKDEDLKAKTSEVGIVKARHAETKKQLLTEQNALKFLKAKAAGGEGALMAELETVKKSFDAEKDQNVIIGNQLTKCRQDVKKVEGENNNNIVKLRETGQQLFVSQRDAEKSKVKFDTLQMAHTTTSERYRAVSSKKELCEDRLRDANIKEKGCANAMTLMKTYAADADHSSKMEIAKCQEQLKQVKEEVTRMAVSTEEKAKSDKLAKQATEKAVAQALETANAQALSVKATAQEAVDQAAKEAVKLANAQAEASANAVESASAAVRQTEGAQTGSSI